MKELNLTITQEDIDTGEQGCSVRCAIAKAFGRVFDGLQIEVGCGALHIINSISNSYMIVHTPAVKGLIFAFDKCKSSISPQTLVFEIPDDIYEKYFNVAINESSNQEAPKGVSESLQPHQGVNKL